MSTRALLSTSLISSFVINLCSSLCEWSNFGEVKQFGESKTFAIVEVKFSGILKIPIIAKPLLAAFGYGYRTPYFDAVKKYQNIEGKWFPSYTRLEGGMTLINKHLFRKNDVYVYDMKQIFIFFYYAKGIWNK